jgi:hypothetical protein
VEEWSAEEAAAQYLAYGITVAEGKPESVPARDFRAARERMLKDPLARRRSPAFITRCSTPDLLWGYLRSKATGSGSWAVRRDAMHEAVDPILDTLAGASVAPTDDLVLGAVTRLNSDSVRDAWMRAVERRDLEPDAAVTAARSLLESTLKTILDDHGEEYDEGDDLPKLYRRVQDVLKLSPAEQTEDRFRSWRGEEPVPRGRSSRRAGGQPRRGDGAVPDRDARGTPRGGLASGRAAEQARASHRHPSARKAVRIGN